jgi:Zn finger protein HypA/HybF involved in hydrogenase expression
MRDDETGGVTIPQRGYICTGCEKNISSRPTGSCVDCGGEYRPATREDLACGRCGADGAPRLLDRSGEHSRLCPDCQTEVGLR